MEKEFNWLVEWLDNVKCKECYDTGVIHQCVNLCQSISKPCPYCRIEGAGNYRP